jgi:hypothetical protein
MTIKRGGSGICCPCNEVLFGRKFVCGIIWNSQMVSVAMAQLGNEGGQKFWSWYGVSHREE